MRKRIIALLLALILTVGLLPTVALAADPTAPTDETPGEDAVSFTKEVVGDKIKIEAYVNGDVETSVTTTPCDIVLVLDQSGSMGDTVNKTEYTYTEVNCTEWSYNKVREYSKNTTLYYQPCWRCGDAHRVSYWENFKLFRDDTYQIGYQCGGYWYALRDNGRDSESTSRDYVFYTGKLYTRTAKTTSTNKYQALKAAASAFLNTVSANAKQNKVDHRVAIVGFGSAGDDYYRNTEILTLKQSGEVGKNYYWLQADDYKNALVSCNTASGGINPTLTNAVNALAANGATAVDLGLEMANKIFKNQPNSTYTGEKARAKIVVVVTDGNPTHSDGFESDVAKKAIENAKNLKDANAMIFTVGIALSGDNATKFISYVSSDYPNATGWTSPGAPIAAAPKYTNYVSDAEAMKEIFSDIASEATSVSASAKLTQTAVLTDTISQYFKLPESATKDSIEVYTSAAKFEDGAFTWDTEEKLTNASVKIDGQKIEVTGFDYTANCVTKTAKNKEGTDFGKKLVIYIPIEKDATKAQFGGYLPTNDDATLDDTNGDKGYKADGAHKDCTVVAPKLAGKTIEIDAGESATTTDLFKGITPNGTEWPDGNNNAGVDLKYTIKDAQGNTIATAEVPAGTSTVTWTFADGKTDANQYAEAGEYKFTIDCEATCKNKTAHEGSTANSAQATGTIKVKCTTAIVTLTKTITGLSAEDAATVRNNLKIYAKDSSDAQHELTKNTTTGIYSAELAAGTYTIVETGKDVTGYDCTTTLTGSQDLTFTVVADTDQSLALTNAYTAKKYSITYEYTGTVPDGAAAQLPPAVSDVAYKSEQTVANVPTLPGYTFVGWTSEQVTPDAEGKFTMPNNDVVFKGSWTEKDTVTINYVVVGPTGCGTVSPTSETPYIDAPSVSGSIAAAENDFRFVGWYAEEGCTTLLTAESHYTPTKTGDNWTGATYYAKFEQIQVDVDLSPYVKKTLEADGTLPTDFSETFKVDVTVDGQRLQQKGTVTMTAAGTINFTMPTVALTKGTHTIMVQEVVDEQTKNSNIAYDTNQKTFVLNIPTSGAAAPVQYGTTNSDGRFVEVKEPAFVTITNIYTEPKAPSVVSKKVVTTDAQRDDGLLGAIAEFENKAEGTQVLYPTGNGTTSNTLEVNKGTSSVILLYAITVNKGTTSNEIRFTDNGATCIFAERATVDKDESTGEFVVTFNAGMSDAVIYVVMTHTLDFTTSDECKVSNGVAGYTATTTVTEKDPDKLTINFADFVKKELTATGSKTASDVNFTVNVKESPIPVINSTQGVEAVSTYAGELLSTTLNAHFDSITGGETKTTPFTGSVEITSAGQYIFELREEDGQRTGVTYDETIYTLHVQVQEKEGSLAVTRWYFTDSNRVEHNAGEKAAFHNTIDTGKDDYYPIIIPTIINKDTGMLNKTDHFAYVIGYPDGTVHPNGQITRAEVATIFFRLLRDEVRDGAFTTSNTYSDVAYGKWYNNPISTMSALGIITGYPDGTFKPNKPITRAEFAAIAARFDETQSGKSATFSDVIGHWAAKEIGIAYYNDWIKGYPDGTFKPDQNITRAEAMTLINRVLERKPESPADLLTNMNKWTDNMDTSKWYYLDVQEATNSHGYTRKTFNYELWRQMLPDPDWSRYER